jgi:hypothetical protein
VARLRGIPKAILVAGVAVPAGLSALSGFGWRATATISAADLWCFGSRGDLTLRWRSERAAPISRDGQNCDLACRLRSNRRDASLGTVAIEPERTADGSVGLWVDHGTLAKLNHLRGPGESYSDAILALAEAISGR